MADDRPADDVAPDEPAGPCRSCGAPTSSHQRYCLECGALVGTRRLEPLQILREREGPAPVAPPAATGRAVPLTAAAAAILVAGFSGALVTGGGDGARAAIVARLPAVTAAPPAAVTATTPATTTTDATPADTTAADTSSADTTADATSPDDAPATDDTSTAAPDDTGDDTTTDPETTPDDATIPPHVWLLALEGPRAQEAVDRVADQGVRLTGVVPASSDTIGNASTLVTGALPAAAGADGSGPTAGAAGASGTTTGADGSGAGGTASGTTGAGAASSATGTAATPSLPEELTAADQTWRDYIDVQPSDAAALPGACDDPPAGDAAAATLAGRSPFGRVVALRGDACTGGTFSLETLTNDVSSGETLPSFSYATLGGCAPPERSIVALPDQVSDTVTAITESTEYQAGGVVIVTTVGAADPCPAPGAAPAAGAPAAPGTPPTPAPTAVLRANAEPGSSLDVSTDLRALTRLAASTLGVDPPGTSGADAVPALELPAADG